MRLFYWIFIGWWYIPIKLIFKSTGAITKGIVKIALYMAILIGVIAIVFSAFAVVAPIIFIILAIVFIFNLLLVKKKKGKNIDIDIMSGEEFESFCAKVLQDNGFENVNMTKASGDQGVDIIAFKDGVRYAIQCKRYSNSVGNKAVQEVIAGMQYYGCPVGIVMTNSYFTKSAKELADKTGIILWDRNFLSKYINDTNQTREKNVDIEGKEILKETAEIYSSLFQNNMHVNVALIESRFKENGDVELIYKCDTSEQAKYLVSQETFLSEKLHTQQCFVELSNNCISITVK